MNATLDLGVIGNCRIASLIDAVGRHVWTCLPRLDGDPVFCALLRDEPAADPGGTFAIELAGQVRASQRYLRNAAILEKVLESEDGAAIRIVDFCPRFRLYGRNYHPAMLIRSIESLGGRPVLRVRLRPLADYGARNPARRLGSSHVSYEGGDWTLRLTTDASLSSVLEERPFVLFEPRHFVLGPDEPVAEGVAPLAQCFLDETHRYWLDWTRGLAIPFEWQEAVIRAAITLKLCAFEDSGAIVAALTTSIPEAAASGRNWDYRHCWLRDSYFTIQALNGLGATRTMEAYLRYLADVFAAQGAADLQPVYGISGEPCLRESTVAALPGYRGMGPVRVGNEAHAQRRHDVYGAAILAATRTIFDERLSRPGDGAGFARLETAGERCVALYDQPDAGLWEYRGRARVHTFSSVMCRAGVERLARIAGRLGLAAREWYWRTHAARMHERICAEAFDAARGSFTESWGRPEVDASLLLLPELGFLSAQDARISATLATVERESRRGDYLLRYAAADDFGPPENAFNLCTFWYINALASNGRHEEARSLFENMLARRNPLGLLSEDLDPVSGELWGNFPQTYSMVGIVGAAQRLSRPWETAL